MYSFVYDVKLMFHCELAAKLCKELSRKSLLVFLEENYEPSSFDMINNFFN